MIMRKSDLGTEEASVLDGDAAAGWRVNAVARGKVPTQRRGVGEAEVTRLADARPHHVLRRHVTLPVAHVVEPLQTHRAPAPRHTRFTPSLR